MLSKFVVDEVWIMVAQLLKIVDIEALSLTSRSLPSVLSTSLMLWREVVRDLLAISPNIVFQRSIETESAASLRAQALCFVRVDRAVLSNNIASFTVPSPELENLRHIHEIFAPWPQILPGTSCAVAVRCDMSFHLFSLPSGEETEVWRSGLTDYVEASQSRVKDNDVKLCSSLRYGHVVIAAAPYMTWIGHGRELDAFVLMQINPTSKPALAPIVSYRLLWCSHGSKTFSVSAVNATSAAVDTALLSLQYQWQIDRSLMMDYDKHGNISDITILLLTAVSLTVGGAVIVAYMPEQADTGDTSISRYQSLAYSNAVRLTNERPYELPRAVLQYECSDAHYIDFVYGDFGYSVQISRDYASASMDLTWSDKMQKRRIVSPPRTGGQRTARLFREEAQYEFLAQLAVHPLVMRDKARLRLGEQPRTDFVIAVPGEVKTAGMLTFDEWTGLGLAATQDAYVVFQV